MLAAVEAPDGSGTGRAGGGGADEVGGLGALGGGGGGAAGAAELGSGGGGGAAVPGTGGGIDGGEDRGTPPAPVVDGFRDVGGGGAGFLPIGGGGPLPRDTSDDGRGPSALAVLRKFEIDGWKVGTLGAGAAGGDGRLPGIGGAAPPGGGGAAPTGGRGADKVDLDVDSGSERYDES